MAGMYQATLVKKDGKLVHKAESGYKPFVAELKEGTEVHMFLEANEKNSNLSQLAKIHKCIRELASHTGESFEGMKLVVKKKSGLLFQTSDKMVEISFADCSSSDINLAVQACVEMGDQAGINLR